jgi:hypothetical protein
MISILGQRKELLILIALFFSVSMFFSKPEVVERTSYVSPPIELKYLTMGFSRQLSDSFWIRAIQDIDYCEQKINQIECVSNSWLFSVINLTVELDDLFKEAYYYGALSLTVIISDFGGASVIFDKGVIKFPDEWPLLYAAGYHALIEEKNKVKASKLYLSAANHGAPAWVRLMAGRLSSEGGDNIRAKEILQQLIDRESDPVWIKKLKNKIEMQEVNK